MPGFDQHILGEFFGGFLLSFQLFAPFAQELFQREEVTIGEVEDLERFFVEINPTGNPGRVAGKKNPGVGVL